MTEEELGKEIFKAPNVQLIKAFIEREAKDYNRYVVKDKEGTLNKEGLTFAGAVFLALEKAIREKGEKFEEIRLISCGNTGAIIRELALSPTSPWYKGFFKDKGPDKLEAVFCWCGNIDCEHGIVKLREIPFRRRGKDDG